MTARTDAERRVRTRLRALDAALAVDPIDRQRVTDLATRVAEAVDGLPSDDRFGPLDRAAGSVATEALVWSALDLAGSADDLYAARLALDLQRRCVRIGGRVAPF